MTFSTVLTKQMFITLLTMYVVSTANLNKRSTTKGLFDGPCFATGVDGPEISRSLKESMVDLKTRTTGLKQDAKLLKDFLKENYQMKDTIIHLLDLKNWTNSEEMIASEEVIKAAINETSKTLQSHHHLLSLYGLYVKQLRTNGTLAEKKTEEETRTKLHNFEVKIYSCICSLSIAIQSFGNVVRSNVSIANLNPTFLESASPLTHATYRAYISMQDGAKLMDFLNTIYQEVEESIAATSA